MDNKIFRKSALDRISSPEQLNEYMKVASPGVWFVLLGLAVTFAAFAVWGLLGSIPDTVEIKGTARAYGDSTAVVSYLTVDEAFSLTVGLKVRVSPSYAPRKHIYGRVTSIQPSENLTRVVVELDAEAALINGANCLMTVIINERKPIDLMFK
jgi:hypothetical protein